MVIDTGSDWVLLAMERAVKVPLSPEVAGALSSALGAGCVRVVGGVAVEVPGAGRGGKPSWAGKGRGG